MYDLNGKNQSWVIKLKLQHWASVDKIDMQNQMMTHNEEEETPIEKAVIEERDTKTYNNR